MSKCIHSAAELTPLPAYTLIKEEYLDDIKSLGLVFRHNKSGARVCVLSSEEENKTFCAAFRTTPSDSTGVPHIIEHTVLNGSEHFPSRDPFMQLAKGSLNTFLNAMTYPDKTLYPVASCNDRDFCNLMHVYLDAVFYPNIYKYRQIFEQEGWHYELENADDPLVINGVVYSEMKGAYSSPDGVIYDTMMQSCNPDTTYGVDSGGNPDVIPTLTYEDYLNFHRRYYHPSNSYIFLCGNMDVEERLTFLDTEYLSHFDAISPDSAVHPQPHFGTVREARREYPIGKDEDPAGKSYFGFAAACSSNLDTVETAAWDLLGEVLLNQPGAPLKQALLDAGIGADIYGGFENHMLEDLFCIVAKNAKSEDYDRFYDVIRESLQKIVDEGINEKAILAVINNNEFRFREADYGGSPRGLSYALNMLQSWLYDDDKPFDYLHVLDVYDTLRKKIGTGYYENLIRNKLLACDHGVRVELVPVPGLNEANEAKLTERLAAYKASLSPEEVQAIIDDTAALREYQQREPTYEELHCIPVLDRHDIPYDAPVLQNRECTIGGVKTVAHDLETNGITYARFCFALPELPAEMIPYLGLLGATLGNMDTDAHTYGELTIETKLNTGSIGYGANVYSVYDDPQAYRPYFTAAFRVLADKVPYALDTVREVLSTTHFHDTKRLREILQETVSGLERRIQNNGHVVTIARVRSYYQPISLYNELLSGMDYFWFLKDLLAHFDEKADAAADMLERVVHAVCDPDRLILSVASDKAGTAAMEENLPAFANAFRVERPTLPEAAHLCPVAKNEGFMISSQVTYLSRAGRMNAPYSGDMQVVRTAASLEYLYQNIRVKGGAYGCGCGFNADSMFFYSYRDPKLAQTNEVYAKTGDYVRNLALTDEELNRFIIGTFSSVDYPMSPSGKATRSFQAYIGGRTYEDINRERHEALDITVARFHEIANAVDSAMKDGFVCAVGNAKLIEENKDMFDRVITIE